MDRSEPFLLMFTEIQPGIADHNKRLEYLNVNGIFWTSTKASTNLIGEHFYTEIHLSLCRFIISDEKKIIFIFLAKPTFN